MGEEKKKYSIFWIMKPLHHTPLSPKSLTTPVSLGAVVADFTAQ